MLKQVKILSPACIFFTLLFLNGCSGQIASLYSDNNKETLISSNENSLKEYYAQLEKKKLSMGLLRQDAGGSDTPFDEEDIIAAFEQLAFYNEYQVDENQLLPSLEPVSLGKWNSEINISTRFGASVNFEQKRKDLKEKPTAFLESQEAIENYMSNKTLEQISNHKKFLEYRSLSIVV